MITYQNQNNKVKIQLKDNNSRECLIFLNFQRETITSDYKYSISFLIKVNSEEYPNENPIVTCLTDVRNKECLYIYLVFIPYII